MTYAPTSAPRLVYLLKTVVQPPKIKSYQDATTMISNWEAKIRQMQSDNGETLSDKMQTTLLMMMSPQEAFDHAGASIENMNYTTLKERVLKFCAAPPETDHQWT